MKKFGRLIYNCVTLAGYAVALVFALIAFFGKDYNGNGILNFVSSIANNSSSAPLWEWILVIATLILGLLGVIFSVFSIIFFFRKKDKWLWSHVSFVLMLMAVTFAMVVYFVG